MVTWAHWLESVAESCIIADAFDGEGVLPHGQKKREKIPS